MSEAVATTRSWVNTPPGDFTPPAFAAAVEAAVKEVSKGRGPKVSVRVRDEKELLELGCGGILGVGMGSSAPPRLVELSYAPRQAVAHLALVGKGVTFDSGGLTIKPPSGMNEMKSDMAGAAAVVQATLAIARLGLPLKVTTFAPMAENMVSGSSVRPGDVLTMYGGTTVEVLNTDAEGRLVLGDALVLATEKKPDVIVDVATLTGHMVVALGDKVAGVMGSPDVVDAVLDAARVAGEESWPMPIPEFMDERIRTSRIADLSQHDWIRWGGGLFAAAFLREFTGGLPWAHLDIAGPAYNSGGPVGPPHLGRHRLRGRDPRGLRAVALPLRSPGANFAPGQRLVALELLAAVVVAHPLRDADHGGVVGRDLVAVAELVRPVDRGHPAAGPLTVVGDQEQRHVADRGAGLDEPLDALVALHELLQVVLVDVVGRAHPGRPGAGRVLCRSLHPRPGAASEPVHP